MYKNARFPEHLSRRQRPTLTALEIYMTTLPVTYGYARVSKVDDESKNLETQLRILAEHGIRAHLVFTDVASGRSLKRPGWQALVAVLQSGDTVVVAFLDRFSPELRGGCEDPSGAYAPGHRHSGHQGEHRLLGGERGGQVLLAVHASPVGLPF